MIQCKTTSESQCCLFILLPQREIPRQLFCSFNSGLQQHKAHTEANEGRQLNGARHWWWGNLEKRNVLIPFLKKKTTYIFFYLIRDTWLWEWICISPYVEAFEWACLSLFKEAVKLTEEYTTDLTWCSGAIYLILHGQKTKSISSFALL